MSDVNLNVNNAIGNNTIIFDASKQIHTDITSRLGRSIPLSNALLAGIARCTNEQVILAQKNFIEHPDNPTVVNELLGVQTRKLLPAEIKGVEGNDADMQLLKSLLGMLKMKESCFTPEDKKCYEQVCKRAMSARPWDGNINAKLKSDDKLWQPLTPLIEKYGVEISEDLMAHMIDQSIHAWCHYHKNATHDWALNNLDKVFSIQVRTCFHMLDFHNKKLSKASVELNNGTLLRHRMMEIMSVIGTIPLTLRRSENIPMKHQETIPEAKGRERESQPQDEPVRPGSSSSTTIPNTINIYGSKASPVSGHCCHHEKSSVNQQEPWSALAERLLASDKLSNKQCFDLIQSLINAMTYQQGPLSQALKRDSSAAELAHILKNTPLLSSLSDVRKSDAVIGDAASVIEDNTPFGREVYVNDVEPYIPNIPEPDYMDSNHSASRSRRLSSNDSAYNPPHNSLRENTPLYSVPLNGEFSPLLSSRQSSSSLSTLSYERFEDTSPRHLLRKMTSVSDNFGLPEDDRVDNARQIITQAKDITVEDTVGLLSHRRQPPNLSLLLAGISKNKHGRIEEANGNKNGNISPPASPTNSTRQREVLLEDTTILKRWLKDGLQDSDEEIEIIDALQHDGVWIKTLEHFLESAFIASPGTEKRSDLRQRYIRDTFSRLKMHNDFYALSEKARSIVETYAVKHNPKVFATSPTHVSYLSKGFF